MPNHFHGRIPGTNIVIDNPSYKDGDCYYLISHPHTDHTGGLTEKFNKGAIHCSTLCKDILLMKFPKIQQHNPIIGHCIGSTFILSSLQSPQRRGVKSSKQKNNTDSTNDGYYDSEDEWRDSESNGVEITLIDANHCPGSVMFLIRTNNGKIYLHTGDFRASQDMIDNKLLTNVWIDIVYIDATFCHSSLHFPTKKQITMDFAEFIKTKQKDSEWKKRENISFKTIYIAAIQLGVEPFLIELCKAFNTKMWLDPRCWKYRHFKHFKSTHKYVTLDQSEAMFHIPWNFESFVHENKKQRKEHKLCNAMYVKPTTMWFALQNSCNTPIKIDKDGVYHVLYSMHSDYNEMRKFISKLNVRQIMPFNDPFIPNQKKDVRFDSVRYVRGQFRDCIENNMKESKDIFIPNLGSGSNSMDMDSNHNNHNQQNHNNHNIIQCERTAPTKQAQNDKFTRILAKLQSNKQRSTQQIDSFESPPIKRLNTAPIPCKYGGRRGAKGQDSFVLNMKQNKNITENILKSPPKILRSLSECNTKNTFVSPMKSIRNRKRKRSPLRNNDNDNINDRASKKQRLSNLHKNSSKKSLTHSSSKCIQQNNHNNNKNRNTQNMEENQILYNEENNSPSLDLIGISASCSATQSPLLSLDNKRKHISKTRKLTKHGTLPITLFSPHSTESENTFDGMDVDALSTHYTNSQSPAKRNECNDNKDDNKDDKNEETQDDDAKMSVMNEDDKDITPGNIDENEAENEDITHSVYKSLDDGIRGPVFLSQNLVRDRNIMVYDEANWDRNKLNGFSDIIDRLQMKRVYTMKDAKYIVIHSDMLHNDAIYDDIYYKLAYEYTNGCHCVREVYGHEIFEKLCNNNTKRGIVFATNRDKYFLVSTLEVTYKYLIQKQLLPLKPKTNEYHTRK